MDRDSNHTFFLLVSFETLRIMRYRKDLSLKSSKIRIDLPKETEEGNQRESSELPRSSNSISTRIDTSY